jgi:hypothetical protein
MDKRRFRTGRSYGLKQIQSANRIDVEIIKGLAGSQIMARLCSRVNDRVRSDLKKQSPQFLSCREYRVRGGEKLEIPFLGVFDSKPYPLAVQKIPACYYRCHGLPIPDLRKT